MMRIPVLTLVLALSACDSPPDADQDAERASEETASAEAQWDEEREKTEPLTKPAFINGSLDYEKILEKEKTVRDAGVRLERLAKRLPEGHPVEERIGELRGMLAITISVKAHAMAAVFEASAEARADEKDFAGAVEHLDLALQVLTDDEHDAKLVDGSVEGFDLKSTVARLEKRRGQLAKQVPKNETRSSKKDQRRAAMGLPKRRGGDPWAGDVEGLTAIESMAAGCMYWRLAENPDQDEDRISKRVAKQYRLSVKRLDTAYGFWVHAKVKTKGPWPDSDAWCG